jgi:hypothetical protein
MTTLTHATVFPHYEQPAETRRRTSWTACCTFRIITDTIRVLLREPRSKYYSASTQASSPASHYAPRNIFTPIGLGAPESITVKSTAADAPRRSAGQSLRRSRRAATPRLRLCGAVVRLRGFRLHSLRRFLAGAPAGLRFAPAYRKETKLFQASRHTTLRKHDTVAIRRGAFFGCPGRAVALERIRDPARTPRRDAGYRNM